MSKTTELCGAVLGVEWAPEGGTSANCSLPAGHEGPHQVKQVVYLPSEGDHKSIEIRWDFDERVLCVDCGERIEASEGVPVREDRWVKNPKTGYFQVREWLCLGCYRKRLENESE